MAVVAARLRADRARGLNQIKVFTLPRLGSEHLDALDRTAVDVDKIKVFTLLMSESEHLDTGALPPRGRHPEAAVWPKAPP